LIKKYCQTYQPAIDSAAIFSQTYQLTTRIVIEDKMFQVSEGIDLVIHHPDSILESMSDWCIKGPTL
jgi:hypothetical protein